jgi:hypothetical protein
MRGEISSGRHSKRHPLDWYVDEAWCAEQLAMVLDGFEIERAEGLAIWDPCCGMGNTMQAAFHRGLPVIGTDLVDNLAKETFALGYGAPFYFETRDFLDVTAAPVDCSIVCNPPYSYIDGIAEAFARHALKLSSRRVCMLLPGKWLAPGKDKKSWSKRSQLFRHDHPPQAVLHFSERPSMPPGDRIAAMGKRAFGGGMVDYCWIVWDVKRPTAPGQTRTIWLPPLHRNSEILSLEGVL